MTNIKKFREFVTDSGYELGAISKADGLAYQGFLNKLNNGNEFKAGEIKAISGFTNMPDAV